MFNQSLAVLGVEALAIYLLVLGTHSLRHRFGLAPFYTVLGGITAVMSWVTDAGVQVDAAGITFMVGSTVFYTSLLLGIFVVYIFDGPAATRIAILTIAGVSALVPMIAAVLHFQMKISSAPPLSYVPLPSLRVNTASVAATMIDLVFLAIAWEILGSPRVRTGISIRAFLTLLGVMWLDVLLFSTGAFFGTPDYLSIMTGTFSSRLIIALFATPVLYAYLFWQNRIKGCPMENRPVLAVLREVAEVRENLDRARQEIVRRKKAEQALHRSEVRYRRLAVHTDRLLESERLRLADDLHDDVGQMLTALKIDLNVCQKAVPETEENVKQFGNMKRMLDEGIQQIHRFCRQLRPGSLDDIGLESALQELTEEWSKYAGISCRFSAKGYAELAAPKRTALFRMLQEALSNIHRHAEASNTEVTLCFTDQQVKLKVSDDGCGIPKSAEKSPVSFGLLGTQERIEAVGGTFRIHKGQDGGTVLTAVIPL